MESSKLEYLHKYVTEMYNALTLPITELNDARRVLLCMKDVENNLMDMERDIEYTNNLFRLLVEYKINISQRDETWLKTLNETYGLLKKKVRYHLQVVRYKIISRGAGEDGLSFERKVLNLNNDY